MSKIGEGKPKWGTVKVGTEGTHSGAGREHGAIFDDYPMKFGVQSRKTPPETKAPPRQRKFYGKS